jgi:hypothetical protein
MNPTKTGNPVTVVPSDQLSNDAYHAGHGLNASKLKPYVHNSPHAARNLKPLEQTDAMRQGTLLHSAILEPERYSTEYVITPTFSGYGKTANEIATVKANPGKILITQDDVDMVQRGFSAIAAHSFAASKIWHPKATRETSIFWDDPKTGMLLKARLDLMIVEDHKVTVVDLKKTRDVERNAFGWIAEDLLYGFSAAHYLEGVEMIARGRPIDFFWIAVNTSTEEAAVYSLPAEMRAANQKLWRKTLDQYVQCANSGDYPRIQQGFQPIFTPKTAAANAA